MDIAGRLADKVDRVRSRFSARVSTCSSVDPTVLRHCDVALKVLHGIIRRLTGSVLFRVHQLTTQVLWAGPSLNEAPVYTLGCTPCRL